MRARSTGKSIRPLLLEGELWLSVQSIQVFNVQDRKRPGRSFFERIAVDLGVDLDAAKPIRPRSATLQALFDVKVDEIAVAAAETHDKVYVVDYTRGARLRLQHCSMSDGKSYVEADLRLEREDPRVAELRASLSETGRVVGQGGWRISDRNDMTINDVFHAGFVEISRDFVLQHQDISNEKYKVQITENVYYLRDKLDPVYRSLAEEVLFLFEQALESSLKRIVVEDEEPTGRCS